jgi:hypothetical protein
MGSEADMVTVYRSADEDAEDDARAIQELLKDDGVDAVLLDDSAPGVPSGAWEVQVPPAFSGLAEQRIAEARLPDEDLSNVSDSAEFDAETVFQASSGPTAEFEAMSVKSVLEASGIAAVITGDSVLPNLSFEVKVARDQAEHARQIIQEAEAVGAQAAEDEERATETPLNP